MEIFLSIPGDPLAPRPPIVFVLWRDQQALELRLQVRPRGSSRGAQGVAHHQSGCVIQLHGEPRHV